MDPKLKAILQKAKAIDQKAKEYETVNKTNTVTNTNQNSGGIYEQMNMAPQPNTKQTSPGSDVYNKRVTESKLPPEIQQAMLNNPIQQADMPGTFSLDEKSIKDINPNYDTQQLNEVSQSNIHQSPTNNSFSIDNNLMRKMIAEEIAKALPSIIEKYFDKKMIKENIRALKSLRIKTKKV